MNTQKTSNEFIDLIPVGHENAISRDRLSQLSGMNDRDIRRKITELNESGEVILNLGTGYFRFNPETDRYYMEFYLAVEKGRIRTLSRKLRKMRKAAGI